MDVVIRRLDKTNESNDQEISLSIADLKLTPIDRYHPNEFQLVPNETLINPDTIYIVRHIKIVWADGVHKLLLEVILR